MATINTSVVLISLPDIFRVIRLNPLAPGNSGYLLWMLMAYMVVTAVLVVSFGRVGDMYGRVRRTPGLCPVHRLLDSAGGRLGCTEPRGPSI